jgi:hypothetical protein
LFAERVKLRNSIECYLATKISNSFSTIDISEFNKILVGLFAIVVVLLDIYLRNNFQDIIRSFKFFYLFIDCKEN